ncbi:double homeobox protein 4-like protein 2 [Peromyscus californicus insignis]|uniref:double homeobox protein 4-like protein 2 n=1 Tax=Peromyscus californicus insignis TaxID=564181 RepID=UPI0022A7379F|nr:double homeobox protein 4-like protein 2 [Peromyscus californicus insignis]XP_052606634.1 double homeobox protein 4-like protein 2 [Peromyscus californicus insignis]XP_052606635.1 double homeobox protein 4-like protein 2 [Peromyscus californicus insignis]XP_052606636.1 double homeobox protein 4-like protein 2 [Peromyscus californicus insignis]XP_052606637.1 double homeobox protein 4-like protein 2 [Peromyscus californicus insignis]
MEDRSSSSSSNLGDSTGALASRRQRTVWKAGQQDTLLAAFAENPYPSFRAREELARELGLPESRIRVWFQNRRNRTREVRGRRGPEGSAGPSGLASPQQRPRGPGARARGGGRSSPDEGRTRRRTRLSPAQLRILLQVFERDPQPKYAARVKLAQETGLPEDTISIWFQNRRARHPGGGGDRGRGQDSRASPPPPPPSPASNAEPEGPPCSPRETEQHAQDDLLPPAAALGLGVQTWSPPSPPPSFPVSSPAAAQPSGPRHDHDPEPHPVARDTYTVDDVEVTLDQLLSQLQADQQAQDTLDPHVPWEDINPTLELPLDQEEYRTLLLDLLGDTARLR